MSFYELDGKRFVSLPWTRGPWSLDSQHGGPPAALCGRAVEALGADMPMRVTRFTFEILRPVPIVALRVDARVIRPGKRVQLCEATMFDGDDAIARAHAWRIRVSDEPVAPEITDETTLRAPLECPELPFPEGVPEQSYMRGMEWRVARGSAFQGPSAVWFRMRVPLIAGEKPSPLERTLVAADCGNGISAVLDFSQLFINVDLSVHLIREPEGEWVALDAKTRIDPAGIGAAESTLWDERARLGSAAQSLYVGTR
jgi:hypothetical protein